MCTSDPLRQPPEAARDLIDFYRRWPEFRKTALDLTEHKDLSSAERETVRWLILLVDRIGEHDLPRQRKQPDDR
jgi:hypothetical protein